ncbi:MAG: TPD domain-containing protein [Candidatus Thermoplasmatota archaeon]|nr:TPD domain-containing protein [Candidatus Thermoplasmatota archaeon]
MYIMDMNTYYQLYDKLNKLSDIEDIHKQTGQNKERLLTMLTQKIVRETKRRYYRVKARESYFARMWEAGDSIVKIAEEIKFSPVLLGGMMLGAKGIGKKKYHQMALHPESAPTPRLKKEMADVEAADVVYSKWGFDSSVARGKEGERKLYKWLDEKGIKYKTEEDLKALNYKKTPDALLEKPVIINGRTVRWIDSKASFGDDEENRQNIRKQLGIYVDMFGDGMAVYWFGITEKTSTPDSIYLMTDPNEDVKEWKFADESHPKHIPKCDIYRSPAPQGQFGPQAYMESHRPRSQPNPSTAQPHHAESHRPGAYGHRHEHRTEEPAPQPKPAQPQQEQRIERREPPASPFKKKHLLDLMSSGGKS